MTIQIDFGLQPLSNRFIERKNPKLEKGFFYPLTLLQDEFGLVHIKNPIPYQEMRPRFNWLTETEPKNHQSDVSSLIANLYHKKKINSAIALSYRDKFHSEELINDFNLKNIDYIDYRSLTPEKFFKIETIQHIITEKVDLIKEKYGEYSLILANRILHHAHRPNEFLFSLSKLLKEDGYVFFEVPDCQTGFNNNDYTIVFEEHTLYFTKTSLYNLLEMNGFDVIWCFEYMYPIENSLSIIAKKRKGPKFKKKNIENQYFINFANNFEIIKKRIQRYFRKLSKDKNICLFGAGHHGSAFINIFDLELFFDFILDDNPNKEKFFLPGTELKILSSDSLLNYKIDVCFLSVSQVNENKLIKKIKSLKGNKIKCYSIFPNSNISYLKNIN